MLLLAIPLGIAALRKAPGWFKWGIYRILGHGGGEENMQKTEQEKGGFGSFQRLPELEPGLNLVTGEEKIVQPLVAQRLHSRGGECLWIDARNNASTGFMAREGLDTDVKVARAFTAHQHLSLVRRAEAETGGAISVLALPSMNYLYQKPSIPEYEKEKLLAEALGKIAEVSETRGIPAVVSQQPGELQWMLEAVASREIKSRSTSQGLSVETDDFTPEAYPDNKGFQTRVNHWIRETEVVKLGTN